MSSEIGWTLMDRKRTRNHQVLKCKAVKHLISTLDGHYEYSIPSSVRWLCEALVTHWNHTMYAQASISHLNDSVTHIAGLRYLQDDTDNDFSSRCPVHSRTRGSHNVSFWHRTRDMSETSRIWLLICKVSDSSPGLALSPASKLVNDSKTHFRSSISTIVTDSWGNKREVASFVELQR